MINLWFARGHVRTDLGGRLQKALPLVQLLSCTFALDSGGPRACRSMNSGQRRDIRLHFSEATRRMAFVLAESRKSEVGETQRNLHLFQLSSFPLKTILHPRLSALICGSIIFLLSKFA